MAPARAVRSGGASAARTAEAGATISPLISIFRARTATAATALATAPTPAACAAMARRISSCTLDPARAVIAVTSNVGCRPTAPPTTVATATTVTVARFTRDLATTTAAARIGKGGTPPTRAPVAAGRRAPVTAAAQGRLGAGARVGAVRVATPAKAPVAITSRAGRVITIVRTNPVARYDGVAFAFAALTGVVGSRQVATVGTRGATACVWAGTALTTPVLATLDVPRTYYGTGVTELATPIARPGATKDPSFRRAVVTIATTTEVLGFSPFRASCAVPAMARQEGRAGRVGAPGRVSFRKDAAHSGRARPPGAASAPPDLIKGGAARHAQVRRTLAVKARFRKRNT